MLIVGTSHFINLTKACDYYKMAGIEYTTPAHLELIVKQKIADGEISLGKPDVGVGQRLIVIDAGCRYALEE